MSYIDDIRHFNRFYTRFMGLFSRDYLKVGLGVTELRIFYELSQGCASARGIAQELDIDEGHMSRTLARFVKRGWLRAEPSKEDARRKDLSLTEAGQATFADLADRTREETARRMGAADLAEVVATMQRLEGLVTPPDPERVIFRDLAIGDIGWLIQRNAETYHAEFGFDGTFEVFAGEILMEMLKSFDPGTHAATIAANGRDRLGSIFCVPGGEPGLAKLRVFYLEPHARGLKLGHRLMERCLEQARALGYARMELMTLDTQKAARHLYRVHGFEIAEQFATRLAGREAHEEKWVRSL